MSEMHRITYRETMTSTGLEYRQIQFSDLRKGDRFKLKEPTGEAVIYPDTGEEVFIAMGEPYIDYGVWGIKALPESEAKEQETDDNV